MIGIGVAALVIGAASIEARYYAYGLSTVRPVRKRVTAADASRLRGFAEAVSFETTDGLTLRGDYVAPKNGVVVVLCHGLFDNRMHFLFEAQALARHGYGSLLFDWRAHGESDGSLSTWGDREQRDLDAAITFAIGRAPQTKIATLGFSIGATAVYLEAAHDPRVRAMIVEAIWPSIDDEMTDKAGAFGWVWRVPVVSAMKRAGVDFSHLRPTDHASALGARPKLFITGGEDSDTPVAVVERVMAVTPEPKELWVVPHATHGAYASVAPIDYEHVLVAFLDAAFGVK